MRVLGIDPGYGRLGVAVVERATGAEELIYSACLTTPAQPDFPSRLLQLGEQIERIISRYQPELMVLEQVFLTKNQKTATRVAEVRGLLLYLAAKHGLAVAEYAPRQVKSIITGYGQASKHQVSQMAARLLHLADDGTKKLDDEFDAMALALVGLSTPRYR